MILSTQFNILIQKAESDEEWALMVELYKDQVGQFVSLNETLQEVRINAGMIGGA